MKKFMVAALIMTGALLSIQNNAYSMGEFVHSAVVCGLIDREAELNDQLHRFPGYATVQTSDGYKRVAAPFRIVNMTSSNGRICIAIESIDR